MNTTETRIDRGSTDSTAIYSIDGDLYYERVFPTTPQRLWQAFTDPAQIPMWWGPHGTTTEVAEMDVRPGGSWRFVSRAADRDDVTFYGEYLEVDPPKTLRWTFMFDVDG
ncbi:MAG TPA: SRPBCC domain-containing protein, partial [Candidatus Limnocylindria bacterium]|nr:SRPBCC domain-containing protein [Candidatus Limnocylindria bacterium]